MESHSSPGFGARAQYGGNKHAWRRNPEDFSSLGSPRPSRKRAQPEKTQGTENKRRSLSKRQRTTVKYSPEVGEVRAEGGIGKRRSLVIFTRDLVQGKGSIGGSGVQRGWLWAPPPGSCARTGSSGKWEGGWKKGRSGQEVYYFFFNFYLFIRRFILR